jgi:hypothetical protein
MSLALIAFIALFTLGWVYHAVVFAWLWFFFSALTTPAITAAVLWPWHHPVRALLYATGYLLIGAGWSVAKWWFVETAAVREFKAGWAHKPPEELKKLMAERSKSRVGYHTDDIKIWIGFWPFSMLFTLLDDPFRRLVRRISEELQGVYQRITDRVWQG